MKCAVCGREIKEGEAVAFYYKPTPEDTFGGIEMHRILEASDYPYDSERGFEIPIEKADLYPCKVVCQKCL